MGSPPEHTILRAASATAIIAPRSGFAYTYLLLQSTVMANALPVPFAITIEASLGAFVEVFAAPTILSYCVYTQRFEAMLGICINSFTVAFKSVVSATVFISKALTFAK